jgi:hypothetical protein
MYFRGLVIMKAEVEKKIYNAKQVSREDRCKRNNVLLTSDIRR